MYQAYAALFLDLSGVLYVGSEVLPGAIEVVTRARQAGLTLRFVTNTATSKPADIILKLRKMGVDILDDELFTAPIAAKQYIQANALRPFCLLHREIADQFNDIEQTNPNCVLLGDARDDLTYKALNQAFRLCKHGAPLIGIGMNKYFKDDEGLKLDAGAFIHAISWAADIEPVIMGKPGKAFFDQVVASTPFNADQCLMVGDDVIGDVEGAINAGLQACLVRTGKYQSQDERRLPENTQVLNSIAELFE